MTEVYKRPTWDEYFIKIMDMVGSRGSCDRGRSGCVVTRENRIISTGYAGSPAGLPHCDEVGHEMHTSINEDGLETRHCTRPVHAEQNAICEAARMGLALNGATLYVKMTPCYTCAKMIINTGIKRVVCSHDHHNGEKSKQIFKEAKIDFILLSEDKIQYED